MNTIQIEELLERLVQDLTSKACTLQEFPFRLMECYDASRNEVNKLRMKHPESLIASDIVWPKKMLYRPADAGQVQATFESLKASLIGKKGAAAKTAPRFIVSTDGNEFLAIDTKTGESPDFDRLSDLPVNYDYLLPMFGVERYKPAAETTADVRAARHMAKFFDAILDANPGFGAEHTHDLNVFMTRILFCMFAEDTGIFERKLFVDTLRREAQNIDGTDTQRVIKDIFTALNIPKDGDRAGGGVRSRRIASDFEYVNGGLFRDPTIVPDFNRRARRLLLEAADLQWHQIHADIFGSMIQAVVHSDMRADFGMHYTSVPNIMKVLEPLFLNSLREQLTAAGDNARALERLTDRIANIRVFDPACGSGNFLIIAYRELRQIETEVFRRIRDVKRKGQLALADFDTGIRISSFYGIDPVDFACETAKLSLWISQYQMNRKLDEICTNPTPPLPLSDAGSIAVGNAILEDWEKICPISPYSEIYIVGNPPYLGRSEQGVQHKSDMDHCFSGKENYRKLDYVACWFVKGSDYIRKSGGGLSFVSTNSICQGEQVELLWPMVLKDDLEISFAYQSFKWTNSAAKNAGVTCVVIGVAPLSRSRKKLFLSDRRIDAANINPYLADAPTIYVPPTRTAPTGLPTLSFGNQLIDGGHLTLSETERDFLLQAHPESDRFLKRLVGSQELLQGNVRYCLWIENEDVEAATQIKPIRDRIDLVRDFRSRSDRPGTAAAANAPHRFALVTTPPGTILVAPRISSEFRQYLTVDFRDDRSVVSDQAFAVTDPPTWLFSVLSSKIHFAWANSVGGRLETRLRYSNTLVYNTFPLPRLSAAQKTDLEELGLSILRSREVYVSDGRSLAWMYGMDTMPADLLEVHKDLDKYLEAVYVGRSFRDDAERLEHLFKLYARSVKQAGVAAAA